MCCFTSLVLHIPHADVALICFMFPAILKSLPPGVRLHLVGNTLQGTSKGLRLGYTVMKPFAPKILSKAPCIKAAKGSWLFSSTLSQLHLPRQLLCQGLGSASVRNSVPAMQACPPPDAATIPLASPSVLVTSAEKANCCMLTGQPVGRGG